MKTIGILQPSYLPWLGFFEQLHQSDVFVLYDDVQFDKNGWRNRNRIKTANGPIWLTVPVLTTGHSQQKICETRIDPKMDWRKKHLKSIEMNYRKAPFYDAYYPLLAKVLEREWIFLVDLDIELIKALSEALGIRRQIVRSSELKIEGDRLGRLIQICQHFGADRFYEGQAGENYIEKADFEKHKIQVDFQHYQHPVYRQLYGAFLSHMSIIDLIFNHGSDSLKVLLGEKAIQHEI